MATEADIHELFKKWRRGIKWKPRGIANFHERAEMRFNVIAGRIWPERVQLGEWKIRRAYYRGVGQYEYVDPEWRTIRIGEVWSGDDYTAFFRRKAEVPASFEGRKVVLRMFVGGESLLSVNGVPYQALDQFRFVVPLTDSAQPSQVFDLQVESFAGSPDSPLTLDISELAVFDQDVWDAYWDLRAVDKALDIPNIDGKLKEFLESRLWEAMKLVHLQESNPAALRESILAAGRKIRQEVYGSDRFRGEGLMDLIGHSHLDVVFLWPYREFVRKVGRTHATMLRLMEQYPEFVFCQSQAKIYADLKQHYPDLYQQVKKRVAEGRWEPIGAFWVEPDCNLISGESFVRQILHGQRFFQEEFGLRSRTCWQPDVFGMSWGMPQILARSGIEYVLTSKMVPWNDTNPWTMNTFWWAGLDGSTVLGIVPPGHFIGTVDPDDIDKQWRGFSDKDTIGETMHTFGWGDGGGGPDPEELESARRYRDFPGLVRMEYSTCEAAFDRIRRKARKAKIPVYHDEIYLEAHRGTFTNKGLLKKLNRRMEFLYREAELAAALAWAAGRPYPEAALDKGWKDLLTTQFHDALPGTHITEVFQNLLEDHEAIRRVGEAVRAEALDALVGRAEAAGDGLAVFNPLLHARSDCASVPPEAMAGRSAGANGCALLQQEVVNLDGTRRVLIRVPEVPPVGYRVLALGPSKPPAETPDAPRATANSLENEFLRAVFNNEGELVSLWDKEHDREVLPRGQVANRFQLFEDTPGRYDAWDLVATYRDHEIDGSGKGRLVVDEQGPVRASLLLEKPCGNSSIRQRLSLYASARQVVFETCVNWVERQRILKVAFHVDVNTLFATYDIAYGNMARPNHSNTSYDAAKFEVPAHQWMDLSQTDYGVSLLNDCKYGHEAVGQMMRLSLLKGSIWPDPEADKGTHYFTYALYPHARTWRDAGTIERALELNNPLVARLVAKPPAESVRSFLRCDTPGVTLEAVKRSEDGRDLVVRLVERLNAKAAGHLVLDRPVRRAWSCNLIEEKESELAVRDREVAFAIRPYEAKTIRLEVPR